MNWRNAHTDPLPSDGQEVLLAVDGIYYCTTFVAGARAFKLKEAPDTFFLLADGLSYYWVEIGEPPVSEPSRQSG
jgi:hypothetical protein